METRALDRQKELEGVQGRMGEALDNSDRNNEMVAAENQQYQAMLRAMGKDLVDEKRKVDGLQQKLGSVNILLVLQRMISLKRAEVLKKLFAVTEEQNALVVAQGGTPLAGGFLERMEHDVRMGFNQKVEQADKDRQHCVAAMEEIDKKFETFEEMKEGRTRAEELVDLLSEQLEVARQDLAAI